MIINCKVTDTKLKSDAAQTTRLTRGYLYCKFEFLNPEDWVETEKHARFENVKSGVKKSAVIDSEGMCLVPWECITTEGYLKFSAHGERADGYAINTDSCKTYLRDTLDGGEDSRPPTPNLYLQMLAERAKSSEVVMIAKQEFTEKQQAQARANIGAAAASEVSRLFEDIADLKYVPIDITKMSNDVGTVEMGTVVNAVTITWEINKEPKSQSLDGTAVDVSARSKTFEDLAISTNKTFSLEVTDERNAKDNASTSINFVNGVYYGVCRADEECTSEAILTLTRKLQNSKGITFNANAEDEQYIVFALPSRYGTPNFNVGGFDGGFSKVTTFNFTNASGYTESYDVWLSDNSGLGDTTVKVS